MVAILVIAACKKVEDPGEAPRLFRPVLKEALASEAAEFQTQARSKAKRESSRSSTSTRQWIKASWQAVKGADSYTAQISTDTFKTIAATLVVDTNYVLFENLKWEKLYQVQVKANAKDTSHNSGIASLGAIKTARLIPFGNRRRPFPCPNQPRVPSKPR